MHPATLISSAAFSYKTAACRCHHGSLQFSEEHGMLRIVRGGGRLTIHGADFPEGRVPVAGSSAHGDEIAQQQLSVP